MLGSEVLFILGVLLVALGFALQAVRRRDQGGQDER